MLYVARGHFRLGHKALFRAIYWRLLSFGDPHKIPLTVKAEKLQIETKMAAL
jgi:hypothetical protein